MATHRRRRNADSLKLTGPQAQYLMNRFLRERRISIRDVDLGLARLRHDIDTLENRLRTVAIGINEPAAHSGICQPR